MEEKLIGILKKMGCEWMQPQMKNWNFHVLSATNDLERTEERFNICDNVKQQFEILKNDRKLHRKMRVNVNVERL